MSAHRQPLSVRSRQEALEAIWRPWKMRTLASVLSEVAQRYPDREFVITDTRSFTYAQMREWVGRLAAGLLALGIRPGEHVAIVLANYPEFVALKFAIAQIGAVAVPVNYLNRRDELAYVLRQSDAVALVTMDQFRDMDYLAALDQIAPQWERHAGGASLPRLRRVIVFSTGDGARREEAMPFAALENSAGGVAAASGADQPAAVSDIIYTSGTTGSPKGVLLTHEMLLRSGYGSAFGRAFEDGHRILFSLPMYHVYGYVEGLLACLFAGGAIIPRLKFEAGDMLDTAARCSASDLLLVPTMTLALLDEQKRQPRQLSAVRSVLSSGGRAPAYIWEQIRQVLGPDEITTGYGMTECTASTTVTRPDDPVEKLLSTNGRLRDVGAAGEPDPQRRLVKYRVVDPETQTEVAPGQVGELLAHGPGVTAGYYNKPAETAAAFTGDGWLHTGDLASVDSEGYIRLAGRLKESYRCGGETVLPSDVEDLLVLHPTVLQAHVVAVPDTRMGEVGAAFVVLRDGATLNADQLIAYCREHLARFKVPRYVLPIEAAALPTTPSGRAKKFMLSEMAVRTLGLAR
jgi:fatty-acyl-CoA synthase